MTFVLKRNRRKVNKKQDAWTCEVCYVANTLGECIACNSVKSVLGSIEHLSFTAEGRATPASSSVVESLEPNAFQDANKVSSPAASVYQSLGVKKLSSTQRDAIARGESSDDKLDDEVYLSPSKTSSPGRQGATPQKARTLRSLP